MAGARVNNLKNVTVDIPRDKFVVITGLSGSGKSSLAFDTLYAEGQRRYVESLSAYARQFLGRMSKPDCDFITGLPPAIAIQQHVAQRNPRSTVGTTTEIYDYLLLVYARIGKTYSPVSGTEVRHDTADNVVNCALTYAPGTKLTVLSPLKIRGGRTLAEQLAINVQQGLTKIDVDGEILNIEDYIGSPDFEKKQTSSIYVIIDRLSVNNSKDAVSRLTDSVETAFFEGDGECLLRLYPSRILHHFSTRFEADGILFEEPEENMFSFNSPLGACPTCGGIGRTLGIDENLVVPDKTRNVYEGAVVCWRGEKMGLWHDEFCRRAKKNKFPIFTPYYKLSQREKDILWHGSDEERRLPEEQQVSIDAFFRMLEANKYKIQYRVMLARYRGKTVCPDCHGTRLKQQASYVKIGGRAITELVDMPVEELQHFFSNLQLSDTEKRISERIIKEINGRLRYLVNVGLGYLTLNRPSNTLSGGESQRISLATSLGSSLIGSLYILDEPSIGLHSRDRQADKHPARVAANRQHRSSGGTRRGDNARCRLYNRRRTGFRTPRRRDSICRRPFRHHHRHKKPYAALPAKGRINTRAQKPQGMEQLHRSERRTRKQPAGNQRALPSQCAYRSYRSERLGKINARARHTVQSP